MKNRCFVLLAAIVAVMALFSVCGCGGDGVSSKQEAVYAVQQEEDFGEILFYKKFYLSGLGGFDRLYVADDAGNKKVVKDVAHLVVYKAKNGRIQCVTLDGNRPPRIILR